MTDIVLFVWTANHKNHKKQHERRIFRLNFSSFTFSIPFCTFSWSWLINISVTEFSSANIPQMFRPFVPNHRLTKNHTESIQPSFERRKIIARVGNRWDYPRKAAKASCQWAGGREGRPKEGWAMIWETSSRMRGGRKWRRIGLINRGYICYRRARGWMAIVRGRDGSAVSINHRNTPRPDCRVPHNAQWRSEDAPKARANFAPR